MIEGYLKLFQLGLIGKMRRQSPYCHNSFCIVIQLITVQTKLSQEVHIK